MGAECLDLAHLAGHVTETLFAFWSLSSPCVVLTIVEHLASCRSVSKLLGDGGKPGVLQYMGLQRVRHKVTEQQAVEQLGSWISALASGVSPTLWCSESQHLLSNPSCPRHLPMWHVLLWPRLSRAETTAPALLTSLLRILAASRFWSSLSLGFLFFGGVLMGRLAQRACVLHCVD